MDYEPEEKAEIIRQAEILSASLGVSPVSILKLINKPSKTTADFELIKYFISSWGKEIIKRAEKSINKEIFDNQKIKKEKLPEGINMSYSKTKSDYFKNSGEKIAAGFKVTRAENYDMSAVTKRVAESWAKNTSALCKYSEISPEDYSLAFNNLQQAPRAERKKKTFDLETQANKFRSKLFNPANLKGMAEKLFSLISTADKDLIITASGQPKKLAGSTFNTKTGNFKLFTGPAAKRSAMRGRAALYQAYINLGKFILAYRKIVKAQDLAQSPTAQRRAQISRVASTLRNVFNNVNFTKDVSKNTNQNTTNSSTQTTKTRTQH